MRTLQDKIAQKLKTSRASTKSDTRTKTNSKYANEEKALVA